VTSTSGGGGGGGGLEGFGVVRSTRKRAHGIYGAIYLVGSSSGSYGSTTQSRRVLAV